MRVQYFIRNVPDTPESEQALWECETSFLPRIGDTVSFRTTGSPERDPFVKRAVECNFEGWFTVIKVHHSYNLYGNLDGQVRYYAEVHVQRIK